MTLAIAVKFPWQQWLDEARPHHKATWMRYPELRPDPALIFVADSRWSYEGRRLPHDGAVKVAALDRVAAATYAGNTDAGEVAIAWLTQYFAMSRASLQSGDLCEVLRQAWRKFNRGPNDVLQFSVGFIDENLDPVLFRLDHWNDFHPVEVPGMTCLGWPEAIEFFRTELDREVATAWAGLRDGQAIPLSANDWASKMQSIVWLAGEKKIHPSVGGPPVCMVVNKSGVRGLGLSVIDTTDEPATVSNVSLDPGDVESFYDHPFRRRRKLPFRWQGTASE